MKAILKIKVRPSDNIGDEVPDDLARQYVRAGLAEYEAEKSEGEDSLDALKAEYKAKVGHPAHHTWDAAKIREKLEAA